MPAGGAKGPPRGMQLGRVPRKTVCRCAASAPQGEDGEEDAVLGAGGKFPLPNTFRTVLTRHAGLSEGIGFGAVAALAGCAPEDAQLQKLGSDYQAYQAWVAATMVRAALCCAANAVLHAAPPGQRSAPPLPLAYNPSPSPPLPVQPCWGELFTLFPSLIMRVPLAMFFQLVPALKPRYYRHVWSGVPGRPGAGQASSACRQLAQGPLPPPSL